MQTCGFFKDSHPNLPDALLISITDIRDESPLMKLVALLITIKDDRNGLVGGNQCSFNESAGNMGKALLALQVHGMDPIVCALRTGTLGLIPTSSSVPSVCGPLSQIP